VVVQHLNVVVVARPVVKKLQKSQPMRLQLLLSQLTIMIQMQNLVTLVVQAQQICLVLAAVVQPLLICHVAVQLQKA
jgi:hypothetical protein